MIKVQLRVPDVYLPHAWSLTSARDASQTWPNVYLRHTTLTVTAESSLIFACKHKMARSKSSSSRGRTRGSTSARGHSSRPHSTSSRSNRPGSNYARPSTHSQNESTQRRVTINPRPSIEPSATPRSVSPANPATQIHGQSESAEELLDHVIVAIDAKEMGNVGCAYYIAREERLLCMEDVPKGGVESVERCQLLSHLISPCRTDTIQ